MADPQQPQPPPTYDWKQAMPPVYDWASRGATPAGLTMIDVLQALGLYVPPTPEFPGLPSLPRPVQWAIDPLSVEGSPETAGEKLGAGVGLAMAAPVGLIPRAVQIAVRPSMVKGAITKLKALQPLATEAKPMIPIGAQEALENLGRKYARIFQVGGLTKASYQPQNPLRVFQAEGRVPLAVGRMTPAQWVKYRAGILSPDELTEARRWYQELRGTFVGAVGEADADRYLMAWASSQQQASPSKGMLDVLRAVQMLEKGVPAYEVEAMMRQAAKVKKGTGELLQPEGWVSKTPTHSAWQPGAQALQVYRGTTKKLGLAEEKILKMLQERADAEGFGQKLSDFLDAVHGRKTRSWMGGDPRGGGPAPVDVHAGRDVGYVDPPYAKAIADTYGPEATKGLVLDLGTPDKLKDAGTIDPHRYEWGSQFYQDTTRHLNKTNYAGGNWTPEEAQAVGWVAIQKALGMKSERVADIFGKNTYRIGFELSPGANSPWAQQFGPWFDELPYTDKLAMTREVLDPLIPEMAERAGVRIASQYYGPGGYIQWVNPSGQLHLTGPPERVQDFLDMVGYAANQQQVIAGRALSSASTPAMKVVFTNAPSDEAKLADFWTVLRQKAPQYFEGAPKHPNGQWEVAPGFTPYQENGQLGLVLYRPDKTKWPKGGQTDPKFDQAIKDAANQVGLTLDPSGKSGIFQLDTRVSGNDWGAYGRGEQYLDSLAARRRPDLQVWLVDQVRVRADQAVAQALRKRGFTVAAGPGAAAGVAPRAGIAPVPSHTPTVAPPPAATLSQLQGSRP